MSENLGAAPKAARQAQHSNEGESGWPVGPAGQETQGGRGHRGHHRAARLPRRKDHGRGRKGCPQTASSASTALKNGEFTGTLTVARHIALVLRHSAMVAVIVKRVRPSRMMMLGIPLPMRHRLVARTTMQHRHHGPALHWQGQQQEAHDQVTNTTGHDISVGLSVGLRLWRIKPRPADRQKRIHRPVTQSAQTPRCPLLPSNRCLDLLLGESMRPQAKSIRKLIPEPNGGDLQLV